MSTLTLDLFKCVLFEKNLTDLNIQADKITACHIVEIFRNAHYWLLWVFAPSSLANGFDCLTDCCGFGE